MDKLIKLKERNVHLSRLDKLGYAKRLYKEYKPSQLELNILRWFNIHSSEKIAKQLKINKSFVYAVIEKFKDIYTKDEIVEKDTYKRDLTKMKQVHKCQQLCRKEGK